LVIDLKHLNNFFEKKKLKYENLSLLRFAPKTVSRAISVDISDAFHHLRLHPDIQ
jgi:Reverse transcriptase (RNA-dependent DNA polymerase)